MNEAINAQAAGLPEVTGQLKVSSSSLQPPLSGVCLNLDPGFIIEQ